MADTEEHRTSSLAHAVSLSVTLAVGLHPLGTVADLGTRLVRARLQAGRDQADALNHLGQDLRTLSARADGELADLQAGRKI